MQHLVQEDDLGAQGRRSVKRGGVLGRSGGTYVLVAAQVAQDLDLAQRLAAVRLCVKDGEQVLDRTDLAGGAGARRTVAARRIGQTSVRP
jgi:hypothetical protein